MHSKADKRITLIDLCGHEKYLKTTIFGLTGMLPDYCLVVVGANMGVSRMTREHIGIAAALKIPLIVVVTKVDIAPPAVFKKTVQQIQKTLRAAKRMPYLVRKEEQVGKAASGVFGGRLAPVAIVSNVTGQGLDALRSLLRALQPRVSATAGAVAGASPDAEATEEPVAAGGGKAAALAAADPSAGADSVEVGAGEEKSKTDGAGGGKSMAADDAADAGAGPDAAGGGKASKAGASSGSGGEGSEGAAGAAAPLAGHMRMVKSDGPGMVIIDSVFNVPGVGTVVAGTVVQGSVKSGQTILLGPDRRGEFVPVVVRSIHVQYTPVDRATAGGSAAFAIRIKGKGATDKRRPWVKRGMALADPGLKPTAYWGFDAEVHILHHQTTLTVGYAPIMHIGVVTQSARILSIRHRKTGKLLERLRTGDKAIVRCQFMYAPQFITLESPLLFREGRAKGVGKVVKLYKDFSEEVYGAEEAASKAAAEEEAASAAAAGGAGTKAAAAGAAAAGEKTESAGAAAKGAASGSPARRKGKHGGSSGT